MIDFDPKHPDFEAMEQQFNDLDALEQCEVKATCAISISFKAAAAGDIDPDTAGRMLFTAMRYFRLAVTADLIQWVAARSSVHNPEALVEMFKTAVEEFNKVSADLANQIEATPAMVELKKTLDHKNVH